MTEPPFPGSQALKAHRRWPHVLAGALLAGVTCALTLWATGATNVVPLPGIPAPGAEVTWLVPALRLASDLAAVITVGALLGAAVLVPGDRLLSAAGYQWMRLASWTANAWALSSLASLPVVLADFVGTSLSTVSLRGVAGFVISVEQGQAALLVAILASVLAIAARTVLTPTGARLLLVVALAATLPPAFTGHTAESNHNLAVTAVALHVIGVVLWAGGLIALVLAHKLGTAERSAAAARFSRLALSLVGLVAGSGILSTFIRLSTPSKLLETSYGLVVLVKVAALITLVAVGWWHRRISLPALGAGKPRAFLRLAVAEVLIFAATIGIAVGLSRTAPPPVIETDVGAHATASVRLTEGPH